MNSIGQYVCGDSTTGISIAASSSFVCGPVDLDGVDITAASVILERVSGTGTLKASVAVSADGRNGWMDLGDLITAVTTAAKGFALSEAGFKYGRFMRVTISETGGSAAAVARCVFSGQKKS